MAEEELDLDTGKTRIIQDKTRIIQDKKSPPNRDQPSPPTAKDGRTLLRQSLTPYLPPPVVRAIGNIDPVLKPYVGPEASITISATLLLCFVVLQLVKTLSKFSRGGKAIADDDDDAGLAAINQVDEFGDTVILCGPMWAGKTRIFHHLCHGDANLPTVMSLRANAALVPMGEKQKPLRVLDYPGHSGLQDSLFVEMIQAKPIRFVLVVDSTQPVAPAADFLYDLFQHAKNISATESKVDIFVACHKADLSSSKNPRRIKISLRTELEKIIKVRSTKAAAEEDDNEAVSSSGDWWEEGGALDLDEVKYAKLHFEATTCSVSDGIDNLVKFCKTGATE